ncbi:coiled-coil and C2 domain-containing protein 1A [Rhineura floridana]|uniref:coiled-coil and C2 domain-containing protein 1A n=1 Tax=Rhineura floridana TaxID=261503 RepID=UPI002AC7E709|nr:coiled-coil and C2 domain-containing protein 1A [Rhineura floridana]XP_061469803.1 coiled-coil and C2 domain-containing protein 1A [Rhineura floridana]XP_061469804.1 coiled-coil and C2 domain-containing protein 1A [Rhineura floridana]XP_061469805.1 coiled-coil and C2 domain-containing protein 1A [Rhineura floridana]XP_061469806.1 coiled-coil and C2 domain-containing protein 1A [Rhineura floridana]XP_061469807.1 coiled-coil and C2 domain-containing protein 1A [Rhineura floridana]
MNRNRKPPPGGKGTATPGQLGLLMDLSPEIMMARDGEDDNELEAELLAIVGGQPDQKQKPNGKTPLPMEAIERMAAFCMKDLDEEDGVDADDLEDDDELMAELNEVLEEDTETKGAPIIAAAKTNDTPTDSSQTESILLERLAMYKAAVANAKQAGESSKVRRYERGLKTLENLLTSVKKGKKIDEDEIPPPVTTGKALNSQQGSPPEAAPSSQASTLDGSAILSYDLSPESASAAPEQPPSQAPPLPDLSPKQPPPVLPKPKISPAPRLPLGSPEVPQERLAPFTPSPSLDSRGSSTEALLQARQREYKLAALSAKQEGSIEMATKYYRIAKSFDPILVSVSKGEAVHLSRLPPPPDQLPKEILSPSVQQSPVATATPLAQSVSPPAPRVSSAGDTPPPPQDTMEALQQRMDRYKTAAAQAKSQGDDRKARMHERIVKQYQEAIRAHKAGKPVEFADLPVPPGFPAIQGMESSPGDQSFAGILKTAMKLASEEEEDAEEAKKSDVCPASSKPVSSLQPKLPPQPTSRAAPGAPKTTGASKSASKVITKAQQQLTFLETRKKQLMQAALRAKQQNDIEGAKLFLRQAKGLDPMIEASQNGLPVDITKVPQAPVNKEDFTLVQRRGTNISPEMAAQYTELVKLMRQQHEMCMNYSKQFTHLGNITETTKFEKIAEDCKKNMEILKQAHTKGFPLPKYHYEQRTFSVIKIFPELNSNDMVLSIVKGINLPAPPGMSPNDLDAFVRFEFPYPNADEAQKDKTNVIKNSNSPEFQEKFKLFINRGHRGLKRAIQTKGIKFEVVHKGGLFKTDRVVGTAQLKLETLETACELREILELLDGRRPTGGKLEVIVRLREPLTSQQLETTTEKWLVIDPLTMPPVALPKPKPALAPVKDAGSSKPVCTLHSFNVLAFDKERLEKKMAGYKQAGQRLPSELVEQHQNVIRMIQWQKSQLQHGGPAIMKEYLTQLERYQQWYTEAARRLGNEGKREAAKDALYKRNLVESELQKFRR